MANMRALWALALSIALAGCSEGERTAALRDADGARRDQENCLRTNAGYFSGTPGDPSELGRTIAAACRDKTDAVSLYAIPHITADERARYQAEAEQRAVGLVLLGRGEARFLLLNRAQLPNPRRSNVRAAISL